MTRPLSRLRPSSDDDPTGVQQLLATLPDPGPMPPDLIARITASLEHEQEQRGPRSPNVRPLPPRPQAARRDADESGRGTSRGLIVALSGAAAAAAVGGVVMINVLAPHRNTDPSATAQLYVAAPGAASPTTAPEPGGATRGGSTVNPGATASAGEGAQGGDPDATHPSGPATLDLHVQASGHRYTQSDLAREAGQLWRSPAAPLAPLSAEAPGIGPLGTELGMSACLSALGLDTSRAVADLAFYENAPAVIVVTDNAVGTQVRVVDRRCGAAGSSTTLAGPLAVR